MSLDSINSDYNRLNDADGVAPNGGWMATLSRVASAVRDFFATIGPNLWDHTMDLLPNRIAKWLDPRRMFVLTVLELQPDYREEFVRLTLPFISSLQMQIDDLITSINLISADRPSLINAVQYIPKGIYHRYRRYPRDDDFNREGYSNMEKIAEIPANERLSCLRSLSKLMINEIVSRDGWVMDETDLIRAFSKIDSNEREGIARIVTYLIENCFTRLDINGVGRLIDAVAEFPAMNRELIIQYVPQFFSERIWYVPDVEDLIKALAIVPEERRISVLNSALEITEAPNIENAITYTDIRNFIKTLAYIGEHKREAIRKCAKNLVVGFQRRFGFDREFFNNFRINCIISSSNKIVRYSTRDGIVNSESVIQCASKFIDHNMSDAAIEFIIDIIAATPEDQREVAAQNAREEIMLARDQARQNRDRVVPVNNGPQYVNVHEGDRDPRTKDAVQKLRNFQKAVTHDEIIRAKDSFINHLNINPNNDKRKRTAMHVLLEPKQPRKEPFGPLIDGIRFSILGLEMSGEEIIGRLWIFAQNHKEKDNILSGMIDALNNSIQEERRVCNQGKVQRLVLAALQGYLPGVVIEEEARSPTVAESINLFFLNNNNRALREDALRSAALQFCRSNPLVNQDSFMRSIEDVIQHSGADS